MNPPDQPQDQHTQNNSLLLVIGLLAVGSMLISFVLFMQVQNQVEALTTVIDQQADLVAIQQQVEMRTGTVAPTPAAPDGTVSLAQLGVSNPPPASDTEAYDAWNESVQDAYYAYQEANDPDFFRGPTNEELGIEEPPSIDDTEAYQAWVERHTQLTREWFAANNIELPVYDATQE